MYLYVLLLHIAALFNQKAKLLVKGQRETLRRLRGLSQSADNQAVPAPNLKGCIWFHAASVGEFEQARPIIERLRLEQPQRKILVTFFSPSGYEMRKDYGQADMVCYLPLATRLNAKRFIQLVQPSMAVFVKYEFWPAYLKELRKRQIPTYIIAAIFRPKQAFFRWYGAPYRRLLRCFTTLFVQDERSRELLGKYGIENVVVAGDTRFDRVAQILKDKREIPQLMRFTEGELTQLTYSSGARDTGSLLEQAFSVAKPKVIVAGSTWPEDERLLARYIQERPDVKLVLTPHEIDDNHLHFIFNLFQGRFVRFTEATLNNVSTNNVLLINRMGMLSLLYRFGQVAYVGGGFGVGIHNTIEAAVYGMPVIFGPNYHKFREAEELIETGGGFSVHDYESFAAAMDEAFARHEEYGRKAGQYVQLQLGATEKIYTLLFRNNYGSDN